MDFKALSRPAPGPALPAVDAVLRFVRDDLAAIIERLSQFAADLAAGLVVQAQHREGAAKLGIRIARLASVLREQTSDAWVQAARQWKGGRGKQGWSQTCWNIGMSDSALRDSKVVADRFDEAAAALSQFREAETGVTLATLARAAGEALVRAASEWNALMQWRKSADLAARQEQEHPELKRWKPGSE